MSAHIPEVPYESFNEYQDMLENLIVEYQAMVHASVERARFPEWCAFPTGISLIVQMNWQEEGTNLFLKLTKGLGGDWCLDMNFMVVHVLTTSFRVWTQTRKQLGYHEANDAHAKHFICALLKQEVRNSINEPWRYPTNMYNFEHRNFQASWPLDDQEEIEYVPIAQARNVQLAFAMITHPRLGSTAAGKVLSYDSVKHILSALFGLS
jgi:hypothetical protein